MNSGSDERVAMSAAAATLLTALTLSPLVQGHTWLFVAAITVVTVMVTGIIARQALRWWPAVALAQAVVLLVALVLLFARARVLEGPGVFGVLIDLFHDGMDVTRAQSPPVEATPGIVLVVAGSVGLVALLVDVLAVTLRQPALAGLPLLAVYCVPAALLTGGLPWMYFLFGAAGFLLLLSADSVDRVRGWGRVLTSSANAAPGPGARRPTMNAPRGGARIAAMTVVAAVLLPALVPGLNNQILGGSDGEGSGEGGRTITRINPILTLRDDLNRTADTPLLRYTTTESNPDPLRIVTADKFDGNTWSPGAARVSSKNDARSGLPPAPGLNNTAISTVPQTTTIQTLELKETYLPLPYPTQRVTGVDGPWLFDTNTLNVISGRKGQTTENLRYQVEHTEVKPTAQQLADAPQAPLATLTAYLDVPEGLDPYIAAKARQVAGTGSQYEQAVRLQNWFRNDFTYSTQAPKVGNSDSSSAAVLAFLRDKQGYCVHFASSMALMARLLNIPARVAVGFLPGERVGEGTGANTMQISAHDAHAWPELFFEGVGWVRFEPTPRSGATSQPEWTIPPAGTDVGPTPSATTTTGDSSEPSATASAAPGKQIDEGASATDSGSGFSVPWRVVLVLAVLLLALAAPLLVAGLARRRRFARLAPAEAAWDELRIGLGDLGVRWAASWTPRAVESRLGAEYALPEPAQEGLHRLVAEIEEARYAPPSPDGELGRTVGERQADVSSVLTAVAAPLPGWRRTLQRMIPPSGVALLAGIAPRVNAAADRASTQVKDQVRERVGGRR